MHVVHIPEGYKLSRQIAISFIKKIKICQMLVVYIPEGYKFSR
jgi:hypothetical protein